MPIDFAAALSAPPEITKITWTPTDVLVYHLSLGARADELDLVHEQRLRVLPTFGIVAGGGPSVGIRKPAAMDLPGIEVDLTRVLHAGQDITVYRKIPTGGTARRTRRVARLIDKQKAAIVELETTAEDTDGPLWTETSRIWIHGEGGFGGDATADPAPTSAPADIASTSGAPLPPVDTTTSPDQAVLYRLNGDYNPLHIDPAFARAAGLERPILHGLATFGTVALALVRSLGGGDPTKMTHIGAGFSSPVAPGDGLRTEAHLTDMAGVHTFTTLNWTNATPALTRGVARFRQ